MKITKRMVDAIERPESGKQLLLRDDTLIGFGARATTGATSFFIEKRIDGKTKRITLGRYPNMTVEQARIEAQKLLGQIATGHNPITEKKESKASAITLRSVFQEYLIARKSLKSTTIRDYEYIMREAFKEWQEQPLNSISKDMISKKHTQLGKASQARANLAMRLLRALFTFASGQYENAKGQPLFPENPVKRLSLTRAWFKVDRKISIIKEHELPAWYKAVQNVVDYRISGKSTIIRDYLLLVLFTGLRRQEAATLTWTQVDFIGKTLTITNTKNHCPHVLPLSEFLFDLLQNRLTQKVNDYVFPGEGEAGHIVEPRKVMDKITAASGVVFTIHDLRRNFITTAESLDIPAYALKYLLNHKTSQDVTAGYIIMTVDRVRKPMQDISDRLLQLMSTTTTAQ